MNITALLLVVLLVLLIVSPASYYRGYGWYGPGGLVTALLVIALLMYMHVLPQPQWH